MIRDPIVEEVRRTRQQILERFGGDLDKYMDYLKSKEAEHPERLVTPEELRAQKAAANASRAEP